MPDRFMPDGGGTADGRARHRLVAVAYGPRSVASVSPVQLAEAAAGICDLMWLVDAHNSDVREMAELMRRFGPVVDVGDLDAEAAARQAAVYRPDGIVTYHDAGMVKVAAIAEQLRLPFVSPATARLLTNKLEQRRALQAAGLQVPRFWPIRSATSMDALEQVSADITWPAVLKPCSDAGSHHTFLARDKAHARALLADIGAPRSAMMLEEYLPGDPKWSEDPFADYVSVESVVSDRAVSHIAITGRFPPAEAFRETGFVLPARLDPAREQAALELASAAIAALDVRSGCLHTEVKFTADGPRILEVNGRIGYGVPAMLELAAGFDLYAASLQVALDAAVSIEGPIKCDRIGYRLFLQPPAISATVSAISGVDLLADRAGVSGVTIHRGPGSAVDWREGTRTFVLAVVGTAERHDEVGVVWRILHDQVSVSYEHPSVPASQATS